MLSRKFSLVLLSGLALLILAAKLSDKAAAQPQPAPEATWSFSGRVYKGVVGSETVPITGVSVALYGSNNPFPDAGALLDSTTTDAHGWYSLTTSVDYEFYSIHETDPANHISVGASSIGGLVYTPNWIEYVVPLAGKTLTGNKFWDGGVPTATPTGVPENYLQGRVFSGQVGNESVPLPGVVVNLYGANNPYPAAGTLLASTVTNSSGWFSLLVAPGYQYYAIGENDPVGYTSVGATSVGGAVRAPNWIEYVIPLTGKTLTGNKFWDASNPPTSTPTAVPTSTPNVIPGACALEGHVFNGVPGDETHPLPDVSVTLYGSQNAFPAAGTVIAVAHTDAGGWYKLGCPAGYEFYAIHQADLPGYVSTGATTQGGLVQDINWIEYRLPLEGKPLTGNNFWDTNQLEPVDIPLNQVAQPARRAVNGVLETVRGSEAAPNWANAAIGSIVRPLYRPDIEEAAYYEFQVLVNNEPAGFIIVSAGEFDFPIVHWNFAGIPPTHELEQRALAQGKTAVRFYKLDVLSYAAEDAQGNLTATLGDLPPKVLGMDMAWLDQPEILSYARWTPDHPEADDDHPSEGGTWVRTGPISSTLSLEPWESWQDLKTGYAASYGVLLEELRRDAAEEWSVLELANENGEVLFNGDVRELPMLCDTPTMTKDGPGESLVRTELVSRSGLLPLYRLTVTDASPGQGSQLEITSTCPGWPAERFRFIIFGMHNMYLPLVNRSTSSLASDLALPASRSSLPNAAPQQSQQTQQSWAWYWAWAGTNDMTIYNQLNLGSCSSGCGATAWAMLFGWADYQAASQYWNYWSPRWGIYRQNGGYGADERAPLAMTAGVTNMTLEIRSEVNTLCAFGYAPTLPGYMDGAADYLSWRSNTSLNTDYSSLGIISDNLREKTQQMIINHKTPAIIGTGWLSHYPLAHGFQWWSKVVSQCTWYFFYTSCSDKLVYNRQFFVNQGWGNIASNGWIPARTWFFGEIWP